MGNGSREMEIQNKKKEKKRKEKREKEKYQRQKNTVTDMKMPLTGSLVDWTWLRKGSLSQGIQQQNT